MVATVLYDDGAGLVKAGLAHPHGALATLVFPALVSEAPRALDPAFFARPDVMVVQNGAADRFLVGQAARVQSQAATYATSHYRYTDTDARVRFAAALGGLLTPHGETETAVRLVVGANVAAYRAQADHLKAFYSGTIRFHFNQQPLTVHIEEVLVTSQPRGAVAHLREAPPASLRDRMEQQPLDRSTIVLLDIGSFTLDVIVLIPATAPDGSVRLEEVYEKGFALAFGVQTLRDAVAAIVQEVQGLTSTPPVWVVDEALRTGFVAGPTGAPVTISEQIGEQRQRLWQRAFERHIRPRLEGMQAHYILVVGGGAADYTYGPAVRDTFGHFVGFAIADHPIEAVLRGYGVLARQQWGQG